MNERTLIDAIEGYIAGDNAIRVEVGVSADSAIKLGVVAVVTTLLCFLVIKMLK